jgi:hypothetical protein
VNRLNQLFSTDSELNLQLFEALGLLTILAIAFLRPMFGSGWFRKAEFVLGKIARRRRVSVSLIGILAAGTGAAMSLLFEMPRPQIHDEFSYLLAADTFSHFRLSNPTHPMWVHFESFHIIHQPTYASKYPPAQGLVLAAGQLISGYPIVGVWISMGLACAAVCWMLQAWVKPSWALLGGLFAVMRLGLLGGVLPNSGFGYWSQSYWGGAVAAMGGAMVFGALRRIVVKPLIRYSLVLAVGISVLANCRPYEGLLVSIPALVALGVLVLGKKRPPIRRVITRIILPVIAVFATTGTAMGFYNLRVTGSIFRVPYQVHEATYSSAPIFLWQPLRPEPVLRHKAMRDYWTGWVLNSYKDQRSAVAVIARSQDKITVLCSFYIGILLLPSLSTFPWVLRDGWMRLAFFTCCSLIIGLLVVPGILPHYGAPMAALIFAFVLRGMRYLRLWRWNSRPSGLFMVRAIPVMCVASVVIPIAQKMDNHVNWARYRAAILRSLDKEGCHLIIVRYGPQHSFHDEWVYNDADIDAAKVVWARELDEIQNRRLIQYFRARRVWLLEADKSPPQLVAYSPADPN